MKDYLKEAPVVLAEGYGKHHRGGDGDLCAECDTSWPCSKVAARTRRYEQLGALPVPPRLTDVVTLTDLLPVRWSDRLPMLLLDLRWFDWIVVESSGGKDSQAQLDVVYRLAAEQGVTDRIVVVHADLGEVEWDESVDLSPGWNGTLDLARRQAAAYGVPFIAVRRLGKDKKTPDTLLDQIERRGKFPDARNRFCTSDQKRGPARAVMTKLARERKHLGRPVRILNCLGMRGQESCSRATLDPFELDEGATSPTTKWVWRWLPIHAWTVDQVWAQIEQAGTPVHPIYSKGLSRASCSFCVLASKRDLLLAIGLRPGLARRYADLEDRIGHTFRNNQSMRDLITEAEREEGEQYMLLFDTGQLELEWEGSS